MSLKEQQIISPREEKTGLVLESNKETIIKEELFSDKENIDLPKEEKIKVSFAVSPISSAGACLCYEEELEDDAIYKFIKARCRASYEYKQYMRYLKDAHHLNGCAILTNLDSNIHDISIEMHHYPIDMHTVVFAVTNKMFNESDGTPISLLDIEEKIMEEHYKGKIGLVPLSEMVHDAWHSKNCHIKLSDVYGEWRTFLEEYDEYIPSDVKERIRLYEDLSDEVIDKFNREKFKKLISEYDVTYFD